MVFWHLNKKFESRGIHFYYFQAYLRPSQVIQVTECKWWLRQKIGFMFKATILSIWGHQRSKLYHPGHLEQVTHTSWNYVEINRIIPWKPLHLGTVASVLRSKYSFLLFQVSIRSSSVNTIPYRPISANYDFKNVDVARPTKFSMQYHIIMGTIDLYTFINIVPRF